MAGGPSSERIHLADPGQVAVVPDKIPNIKPKLKVARGEHVKTGAILFSDKHNPRLQFLSPGGGTIQSILYGPRRKLEAIVIERDQANEPFVQFPAVSVDALKKMGRDQIVEHILQGGLWWIFRQLPFRNLPNPETVPPLIIISLSAKEPFQPQPAAYLKDRMDLLAYGLEVLHILAEGRVMVLADAGEKHLLDMCGDRITHGLKGDYPADDPGTVLYHTKTAIDQNRAWYISGQDLLLLAQLLTQGRYPVERTFSVAGSSAPAPIRRHYVTRLGAPLAHLAAPETFGGDVRPVVGGLFTGYTGRMDGFMGLYESALNLVPAGAQAEFLELFNPGFTKPTYSRTFLSRLNPRQHEYDCNLHGSRRACIACMHCADICPVDILPHMTYKAILAEEVEEYLEHGLLDCVECGLCAYVCPSKIELSQIFKAAKAAYALETYKDTPQ